MIKFFLVIALATQGAMAVQNANNPDPDGTGGGGGGGNTPAVPSNLTRTQLETMRLACERATQAVPKAKDEVEKYCMPEIHDPVKKFGRCLPHNCIIPKCNKSAKAYTEAKKIKDRMCSQYEQARLQCARFSNQEQCYSVTSTTTTTLVSPTPTPPGPTTNTGTPTTTNTGTPTTTNTGTPTTTGGDLLGGGGPNRLTPNGEQLLQNKGNTVNSDGTFTNRNGQTMPLSSLSTAAGLQAAGLSESEIAGMLANGGAGVREMFSASAPDGEFEGGGGTGMGSAVGGGTTGGVNSMTSGSRAGRANIQGLSKSDGQGGLIGVSGDGLFNMIRLRYEAERKKQGFTETPSGQ